MICRLIGHKWDFKSKTHLCICTRCGTVPYRPGGSYDPWHVRVFKSFVIRLVERMGG